MREASRDPNSEQILTNPIPPQKAFCKDSSINTNHAESEDSDTLAALDSVCNDDDSKSDNFVEDKKSDQDSDEFEDDFEQSVDTLAAREGAANGDTNSNAGQESGENNDAVVDKDEENDAASDKEGSQVDTKNVRYPCSIVQKRQCGCLGQDHPIHYPNQEKTIIGCMLHFLCDARARRCILHEICSDSRTIKYGSS